MFGTCSFGSRTVRYWPGQSNCRRILAAAWVPVASSDMSLTVLHLATVSESMFAGEGRTATLLWRCNEMTEQTRVLCWKFPHTPERRSFRTRSHYRLWSWILSCPVLAILSPSATENQPGSGHPWWLQLITAWSRLGSLVLWSLLIWQRPGRGQEGPFRLMVHTWGPLVGSNLPDLGTNAIERKERRSDRTVSDRLLLLLCLDSLSRVPCAPGPFILSSWIATGILVSLVRVSLKSYATLFLAQTKTSIRNALRGASYTE